MSNAETIRMISVKEDSRAIKKTDMSMHVLKVSMHVLKKFM